MTTPLRLVDPDREYVTSVELTQAAHITYRQLDYWTRTGLLTADVVLAGSGYPRAYSTDQVQRAHTIKALLDGGVSLPTIREVVDEVIERGSVKRGALVLMLDEEQS